MRYTHGYHHTCLDYGKMSKNECKGEGRVKSFLLFRPVISRTSKKGRYRVASVITQQHSGKETEARLKKEKWLITLNGANAWIVLLLTQLYRDRRRRGSLRIVVIVVFHFERCSYTRLIHPLFYSLFFPPPFLYSIDLFNISSFDSPCSLWYAVQVVSWIIRTRHRSRVADFSEAYNDETSASNYLSSIEYREILRHRTIRRNEILIHFQRSKRKVSLSINGKIERFITDKNTCFVISFFEGGAI